MALRWWNFSLRSRQQAALCPGAPPPVAEKSQALCPSSQAQAGPRGHPGVMAPSLPAGPSRGAAACRGGSTRGSWDAPRARTQSAFPKSLLVPCPHSGHPGELDRSGPDPPQGPTARPHDEGQRVETVSQCWRGGQCRMTDSPPRRLSAAVPALGTSCPGLRAFAQATPLPRGLVLLASLCLSGISSQVTPSLVTTCISTLPGCPPSPHPQLSPSCGFCMSISCAGLWAL